MRKNDVNELLKHARRDLKTISKQYEAALEKETIPSSLQIDVKNFMENLRSALDYMAHDIYEVVISPHRKASGKKSVEKIYFPYGRTLNDFKSGVGSSLPELKNLHSKLYSVIESVQPFVCGSPWLYDFCTILNQKKHESLRPQVKEVKKGLVMQFPGGTRVSMGPGCSIRGTGAIHSGGGVVQLNNETISGDSPARNVAGGVGQIITKWVSFKFSDTSISVLPFLETALDNLEKLMKEIYNSL